MTTGELHRAVVQPAVRAGLTVEGALLAHLTAEAKGQHGVLALLSHALLETWHRRRGNALTLAGFQAAGPAATARDCALSHRTITRSEWRRYLPGTGYRPPCSGSSAKATTD